MEKVISSDKEFRHKCESKKEAEYLRFTFYSFLKACKKSEELIDRELAESGAGIMFCVEDNILILRKRDRTKAALSLTETFAQFEAEVAKSELDKNYKPSVELVPKEATDQHEDLLAKLGYGGKNKKTGKKEETK